MSLRLDMKCPRLFVCILAATCCLPAGQSSSCEPDKAATPAADSMIGKQPGQGRDDNGLKMKLVWCPPGEFTMGSPKSEANRVDWEDQVEVTLTNGFWLGRCEVTQSEWKHVMGTEPWKDVPVNRGNEKATNYGDDFAVAYINWESAMEFCSRLTEQEQKAGRVPDGWEYALPTEAQWEYACRAQTDTTFSFGDDEPKLGEYGWFAGNAALAGEKYPHEVGKKKPNPWGLHDMHGNVFEWCSDWWSFKLPGGRDPEVALEAADRAFHVFRGGSWTTPAKSCRSANRIANAPSARLDRVGFRVALVASGKPSDRTRPIDK
jgi:formylglycine-generating enzyme required for sulfatase activity